MSTASRGTDRRAETFVGCRSSSSDEVAPSAAPLAMVVRTWPYIEVKTDVVTDAPTGAPVFGLADG